MRTLLPAEERRERARLASERWRRAHGIGAPVAPELPRWTCRSFERRHHGSGERVHDPAPDTGPSPTNEPVVQVV